MAVVKKIDYPDGGSVYIADDYFANRTPEQQKLDVENMENTVRRLWEKIALKRIEQLKPHEKGFPAK